MQELLVTSLSVSKIIQLSVAPVFLLTGIAGLLTVLTNRLGRIIDRTRILEERYVKEENILKKEVLEINTLSRRAKWINRAITLCTCSALLVCMVIATLFIADFLSINVSILIAALFTLSMLSLIFALIAFLREIYLAVYREEKRA